VPQKKTAVTGGIGNALKQARLKTGMSQRDLARKTSMTVGQLSQIETGVRENPQFATVSRIAAALGLSLDAIGVRAPSVESSYPKSSRDRMALRREVEEMQRVAARLAAGLTDVLRRLDGEPTNPKKKR
jgi:transcriptional regulator with XRE-family HTH domain